MNKDQTDQESRTSSTPLHAKCEELGIIDTSGYNKADVLCALYNGARPQGLGFLHFNPTPMQRKEAECLLKNGPNYFDYLQGRVMKVRIDDSGKINARLYDRDNGQGAAARAIATIRHVPGSGVETVAASTDAYRKGTVQISVNRQHNGIDYSDIPVEVEVIDVTTNRGETDDPQAELAYYVELGWAFVTETTGPFNAGRSIELRDDEENEAREKFIEEKLG